MKRYLLISFAISLTLATAFIAQVSGDNLGGDFYKGAMTENGEKYYDPRIDQFAMYISLFSAAIFGVLAIPALFIPGEMRRSILVSFAVALILATALVVFRDDLWDISYARDISIATMEIFGVLTLTVLMYRGAVSAFGRQRRQSGGLR